MFVSDKCYEREVVLVPKRPVLVDETSDDESSHRCHIFSDFSVVPWSKKYKQAAMAKAKKKKNDAEHKARVQEKVNLAGEAGFQRWNPNVGVPIQAQRKSNKKVKKSKDKAEEPEEDIESILAAFKKEVWNRLCISIDHVYNW